jgi:hypothetical protein
MICSKNIKSNSYLCRNLDIQVSGLTNYQKSLSFALKGLNLLAQGEILISPFQGFSLCLSFNRWAMPIADILRPIRGFALIYINHEI